MSNYVFVIDTNHRQLNPCTPGVARSLLNATKAAVYRRYPFTIILKKEVTGPVEPCQLKIDPGSRATGLAILQGNRVLWGAELTHRGQSIKNSLDSRRSLRRGRRGRKTRYRQPRFLNRTRPKGWLAPSLMHRVLTTMTWVNRLIKLCPIQSITQELVRFDTQVIQNPEISGTQYQQGTLYQYETREYLLEKWGRQCAYCGQEDTPLEVEHIVSRSKGGSNRVSNLTIACVSCNQKKSNRSIEDFLSGKPDLLKRIKAQAKAPLKDAAAVNATRWKLFKALKEMGLPVSVGTGGQTKFNRKQQGLPKAHWIDAAATGKDIPELEFCTCQPLLIQCSGHGTRQMCGTDKYGFPIRHRSKKKIHYGFQTGDIVKAFVTQGKKIGSYMGRVLCRKSGNFDISTKDGRVAGINHKHCTHIHKKDGYNYAF
ncbi:RNA-guided endonuclease IscB [Acaryochloris sp. CCMEE 5410]|uniref:RNA-guided endonuclease IscB n=1 Tax=Acaryochloris sp. CCMEE 5410 TaxID=310037 RepID=UPI000248516A|nr:RNA-guided endonuclease IscB [Acaryochloris sp. CCMEE 5410]KAI9130149.1 RRXRR domain-containing protein [Acaryochloris sp. CCMEE 5410]